MANPFANLTPQALAAREAKLAADRAAYKIGGKKAVGAIVAGTSNIKQPSKAEMAELDKWFKTAPEFKSIKAALPKTKKPLMNKTELAFYEILKARGHQIILCQSVMLRLGDGCQYRPDFVVITYPESGSGILITCYETKAPHKFRKEGITKIKVAAHQYPWISFRLVMRDKSQWEEKEIGQ